jgi:hypothetical protein
MTKDVFFTNSENVGGKMFTTEVQRKHKAM